MPALFVCVLYCGTVVVRALNTSGHGGVWPGEEQGMGADGSLAQGLVWQADPRQRPEDLCRHVLSRLLHSPTPSFSWRPTTVLTATHVIGYK